MRWFPGLPFLFGLDWFKMFDESDELPYKFLVPGDPGIVSAVDDLVPSTLDSFD